MRQSKRHPYRNTEKKNEYDIVLLINKSYVKRITLIRDSVPRNTYMLFTEQTIDFLL